MESLHSEGTFCGEIAGRDISALDCTSKGLGKGDGDGDGSAVNATESWNTLQSMVLCKDTVVRQVRLEPADAAGE